MKVTHNEQDERLLIDAMMRCFSGEDAACAFVWKRTIALVANGKLPGLSEAAPPREMANMLVAFLKRDEATMDELVARWL